MAQNEESPLWGILNWLQEQGLTNTSQVLLKELEEKHGTSSQASSYATGQGGDSVGDPAEQAGAADLSINISAMSRRGLLALAKELQAEAQLAGGESSSSGPATWAFLPPDPALLHEPVDPNFTHQAVPWDESVNEYDTPEDVGYDRRDVSAQQQFMELELDSSLLRADADASSSAPASPSASPHAQLQDESLQHGDRAASGEYADNSDEDTDSDISGQVVDLMPSPHGSAPGHAMCHGSNSGTFAHDAMMPASVDIAWDLGPIGIRIAEPVTTPTKSKASSVANIDEPKPVLSRVESLSSSFKDFDIDCTDEDVPSRRMSSTTPDHDNTGPIARAVAAAQDVIDLNPLSQPNSATHQATAHEFSASQLELNPERQAPSPDLHLNNKEPAQPDKQPALTQDIQGPRTPSRDSNQQPEALALAPIDLLAADITLAPPVPSLLANDSIQQQQQALPPPQLQPVADEGRSHALRDDIDDLGQGSSTFDEPRENVGGGFSFPITASNSETQPDHRLFKSWPSVRSSCASEGETCTDEDEDGVHEHDDHHQHDEEDHAIDHEDHPYDHEDEVGSEGAVTPVSSAADHLGPRYSLGDDGNLTYEFDAEYIARKYEILSLRVYHRRGRTGFEETKDLPIRQHDLIAGRYQVVDFLGSAAFSRAVQALDVKTGLLVCLKIIKNNKDYFDQSLDEIKLLKYVNSHDPEDKYGIVRLYDYFYYKEHLFLVCELLRANLYEFQKYNRESNDPPYFTNARIQQIAIQVLRSLSFLHALGLIHSDLKPENILMKSYSKCQVKVIDLGSSCFVTDQLSSYVQSRSYRAPEVILGLPYDQKIDIWSLGCILAELSSGQVLFQNDSLSTLLARLEGILGPIPQWMIQRGRYANRFFTRSGQLYEKNAQSKRYELLLPKRTSLLHRVPDADEGLLSFISYLLHVDPNKRPSAAQALQHPWISQAYVEANS